MSKYTRSCRNQPCLVRIPEVCINNPATTVGAHLNGAGLALKALDIHLADACSSCHEWLDGGYVRYGVSRAVRDLWHLQAILRTQTRMVEDGTLVI